MLLFSFSRILRFISYIPRFQKSPRVHNLNLSYLDCLKHTHNRYSDFKVKSRSTIFALSTPSGVSAIAVIRISGPNASEVLYKMGNAPKLPEARKAVLFRIKDPVSKELLDRALVLWFPAPNSFTGEDMCELHVHGGIAVMKSIQSALLKMPHFRMAEPGEFTKRAFMSNKLDLTEIEGLADLLHAETEVQQKQALRQMGGQLNKLYNDWSSRIKKCLANVEAYIDFSEDQHLDNSMLKSVQIDLDKLKKEMKDYISDYRRGERLRNGVSTVLIGKPNVGKSSLLNSLCERDISIVSPTAGTTRDIIETSLDIGGYLVNISDTAGIRETADSVELEGVRRAKDRSSKADLLIFILEARRVLEILTSFNVPNNNLIEHLLTVELGDYFMKEMKTFIPDEVDSSVKPDTGTKNRIILLNKIDLLHEDEKRKIVNLEDAFPSVCAISCTEGLGMDKFLGLFSDYVKEMCSSSRGEEPTITQERHRIYIANSLENIINYEEYINIDMAIAAEKLRIAMNELGKITGKVKVDDILDVIFKDFCIGK